MTNEQQKALEELARLEAVACGWIKPSKIVSPAESAKLIRRYITEPAVPDERRMALEAFERCVSGRGFAADRELVRQFLTEPPVPDAVRKESIRVHGSLCELAEQLHNTWSPDYRTMIRYKRWAGAVDAVIKACEHEPLTEPAVPDQRKKALDAINKAQEVVKALCLGDEWWRMSVPAQPDSDPDLVISDALHKARQALTEPTVPDDPMAGPPELVEAYRAACRRLKELGEESVPLTLPTEPDSGEGEQWDPFIFDDEPAGYR